MTLRRELLEELIHLAADARGDLAEVFGDGLHRARVVARRRRGLAHPRHLVSCLDRAVGRGVDAARDLMGGGTLLCYRGGDRAADVADLADGALDSSQWLRLNGWWRAACW